ncbi:tenascin isoform X1 [Denticeps clupeoides]|uniref:tenascin isoform X1 n=1 Tax=Denticeps clupeoides TaxID=299321 RepID=UPI0010A3F133|nr:tenascin-like isoform X1 [Denticeps clupeoides]
MGSSCWLIAVFVVVTILDLSNTGLVKKMLRHRRETLTSAIGENITLPRPDLPVVFNHVYNINVPAGSLCSVDLDSPGDSELEPKDAPYGSRITEPTLNGENQIVFTHRINIPKQACGCSDGLPDLKDLLSRLEVLEGEISSLREQCSGESGCCAAQVRGEVGTKPYCNGRGNFSTEICGCICEPGWRGPNCTEQECPDNCSDQGRCVDSKCECFPGFSGADCSQRTCPVNCGRNGRCVDGLCVCAKGFSGHDCSETDCLNNCLGRGTCKDGDCVCDLPWAGFDCSELICPNDCYDRGRCNNGTCECDEGFTGADCSEYGCPKKCLGRGFCLEGRCVCSAGYTGQDCSELTCLHDCSGRGRCAKGICICDAGFHGEDCSQLSCPNNCNYRGRCINGRCTCDAGFQGEDCSELSCPNDCQHRGRCVNGQCVCNEGYTGEDCSIRACPNDCSGRGHCKGGQCLCHPDFTGEDCSQLSCSNNCQNRGRCVAGQCVCDMGFAGEDCSLKACLNGCLGRGQCVDGRCVCQEGYAGEDCSEETCPAHCNDRGRCINRACVCDAGYAGPDCRHLSCPNNCNDQGQCVNGQCVCDEGYVGYDCSQVSAPKDLTVTDVNAKSVNLTWMNEMLVTEYLVTYAPTAPGGLRHEFTVPGDRTATTIGELEPGIEYMINVYAVLNNKKSIPVSARVATYLPQPDGLKFKSVRETSVEVSWDQLDNLFDKWELTFRKMDEDNGKIVNTLNPEDTSFTQHGLGPGQEYEVSVGIVKNNTRGPPVTRTVLTRIDAPQQVEVRDVTDTFGLISWSQPVAEIDRITLSFGPTSDSSDRTVVHLSSSDSQYKVDGLTPDTEYEVLLVSRRGGVSSEPASKNFITDLDAPRDVQVVGHTENSITLEWMNSQAPVDGYRLKYGPVSTSAHSEDQVSRGPGYTTRATLTGLKPGTEYGIGVTGVKRERESLPATANAVTDLDAPRDLEVADSTETSMTLVWKRPRAKISNYRLVFVSADGRREEVDVPSAATTYTLNNLTPGVRYSISLTAERGRKKSEPAMLSASTASFTFYLAESNPELSAVTGVDENIISFLPIDNPDTQFSGIGVEDQTGTLAVSDVTSDGFILSWETKGHFLYDSYAVELKDVLGESGIQEFHFQANTTGTRIHGLNSSTEYQVKLYGVSSSQRSLALEAVAVTAPKSASADVVALRVKSVPATQAVPFTEVATTTTLSPFKTEGPVTGALGFKPDGSGQDPPRDLSVSNSTNTSLTLTWSAPDGVFDGFRVELKHLSNNGSANVKLVPGGAKGAQIGDLKPGMQYEVSLYGMVDGEQSPPVLVLANTTKEEKVPQMGSLTVSDVSWDSFNVSWTVEEDDFESFVIEVENAEGGPERQNLSLSGDALSLFMSGLSPSTTYLISLYGVYRGSVLGPLFAEATTVKAPVVGSLYVGNITSESFSVFWNGSEGVFEGFVLEIIDSSWRREPLEFNISQNATSHDITGLLPDTDYIAYLYGTVQGRRTIAVSTVASTAAQPDLSGLVVSNITSDRLSLLWRTGEKAFDNFIVEVRESALPSQAMGRTLPGGARSTVLTGLKGNTRYNIKLYANSGGQNTAPLTAVATTEAKPKLGRLSVSKININNFTLAWRTVSGHFDGFDLRVTDRDMLYDTVELRPSGNMRKVVVGGLVDSTTYDIELYGLSHGRRTPMVSTQTTTASLPKVENLTVSDITAYGFRVSWAPQDGGQPARKKFSHFHIELSDSGRLLEPQEYTVPGNQTSMDIWGLITGIGYEVKLTGVTVSGLRSRPLTTVAVTEAEPEIEHLFVSDVTPESFRLAWTAEEDVFDRFVIKVRDSRKLAHPQEYNVAGDERTKVLTNLMGGTEYDIELYGVTLEHRSQPITAVARTGLGTPRGIRFSEITDTSGRVHWTIPHAKVDTYRVTYRPLQEGNPTTVIVDGTDSQTILPNLIPGETYHVTVTAVKGLEESDPVTDTLTTALDMPRSLTAVNITDSDALLLWQPSVATVDGYVITYTTDTGTPMVERVSGNIVEFEMNSLTPASQYIVNVYGTKGDLKSPSATTEFTTDVDPPRDLAASNIQRDSAVLTWQPPRATITGYILYFESSDGSLREVVLDPTVTSYNLAELSPSTVHNVRLQAVAGAQRSRSTYTVFTTVGMLYRNPKDCSQTLLNGDPTSGLHTIYLGGKEDQPQQVYCDMTSDGGGWLVILRRLNGATEFFRNWRNYTNGFGDMKDEFWLGLSSLHKITSAGHYELRVDLRDGAETVYAQYDKFYVAEPRTRYKLQIGAYSGTAGDSMSYHQNRPFSTYDNDNDIAVTNCALSYKGAFWYKNCHRVNLMGRYGDNSHSKGINWFHWKGHEHSIPFAEMKIRPVDFRNLEGRRKRS